MKPKITKKPWGQEELLFLSPNYAMKKITIRAGQRLSLQYHQQKEETVYVLSGILLNWQSNDDNDFIVLRTGDTFHCEPKQVHRFGADLTEDVVLIECSSPELDDVVRLADDYNRK